MLRWGREHQAKEKEVLKEKRELVISRIEGVKINGILSMIFRNLAKSSQNQILYSITYILLNLIL